MTALGDRLSAHTATLVVSAACAFACPASAVAADFTWSGATTAPHWSGAANWAGGTAPSGAVGTLSFPALASCPGADTCYRSDNDVSGIAADALSISGGGFYAIGGDGLALGAGGMTISPGSGLVSVDLPLALGADQSWSVAGAQVLLSGAVAGPSRRLRLGLRHGGVVLSGDDEVGALDILGADATEGGATAGENGQVFVGGSLNATDGQPVTVEHALLSGTGAVGPLSSVGGRIVGGGGYVPNPTGLTVDGAVSLDAGSDFAAYVTSPGTGFVPLRATGDVGLGGASLMVALDPLACPTLPVGDTEPLITTTGTVSGNFASLPDGATVVDPGIGCDKQTTYRIHYATHAVTVTVVSDSGGDFTWTGASPGSQGGSWSMASNWAAGTPSGAVDALTFPALSGCPATDACNAGDDDIAGITAHAVTIDFGEGYSMDGEKALRIGAGGLRASTSVASPSGSSLNLPIALAAPQSWTIQGAGDADAGLDLGHGVTGPGQSLGIAFSHAGYLDLETDSEVGAATITGADASLTGEAAGRNGWLQVGSLNASDGNPIGLVDARLDAGSAIGPVTSAGGELGVARGEASGGTLTVAGSASFDAASALFFTLPGSELDATGDVALGGARLELQHADCDRSFPPREVETLVHAAGSLTGTAAGLPDGATVVERGLCGADVTFRIGYTAHAMTATVVDVDGGVQAPANSAPPTVSGVANPGRTLTEGHGIWSNAPASFAFQWQRCDSAGGACTVISGATAQTYTLTAADVGHAIRVLESATNAGGTGGPVASPPTGVVRDVPSNAFTVRVRRAERHGAIVVAVRLPGPGALVARGAERKAAALVQPASARATGPGTVLLALRPSAAAREQLRRHRLTVRVRITFTPTGGTPGSRTVSARFSRRPRPLRRA